MLRESMSWFLDGVCSVDPAFFLGPPLKYAFSVPGQEGIPGRLRNVWGRQRPRLHFKEAQP